MYRRLLFFWVWVICSAACAADRPNILWITSEDNGPQLGCYGDSYATTPNIDRLAAKGVIYRYCWSNAPVCAPARTAIISGLYPPSTGAEHMRSLTRLPDGFKMYPQYLREAGYYCTNNAKEDYNLEKPGKVWDASSGRAHWRNRGAGQPFFAIFNTTVSHESQIRKRPHRAIHDPASVRVPAYHPDRPEIRQDWAQYYDKLTEMDAFVGDRLREVEEAGLAEETIVFYYGDHGAGMPRSKRWPYNSGLHVPLVVYIPQKYRHLAPDDYRSGGASERLVSFVDLAPTVLSLAGATPPDHFQGHAFLGPFATAPPAYIFGFRGRMDERYDMVRSVRDRRYVYIRNFMPHKIYGQHIAYMFQTPTTRVWKELYDQGALSPPQTFFWETKPTEELYDLQSDPDEVHNVAGSMEHQSTLTRLRAALREHTLRIRDVGFLPEDEIHARGRTSSPYDMGHDGQQYPLESVMDVAERASAVEQYPSEVLLPLLDHSDSAVRYWAAMGLLIREQSGTAAGKDRLMKALQDGAPSVRVVAAQALAQFGEENALRPSLEVLIDCANIEKYGVCVAMMALNAIDAIGVRAEPIRSQVMGLPRESAETPQRMGSYVNRLVQHWLAEAGQ